MNNDKMYKTQPTKVAQSNETKKTETAPKKPSVPFKKVPATSGIPMPEATKAVRVAKYPWNTMKVGDSFEYPGELKTAASAAGGASKRAEPKKFVARAFEGTVRVWRTA